MKARVLVRMAVLVALGVGLAPALGIPFGTSRLFPLQSVINVVAAVVLGPAGAVVVALLVAVLRNVFQVGTPLAFPGSLVGAFLAGILYRLTGRVAWAVVGEMVGTGLLAAVASVPLANWLFHKSYGIAFFVPGFLGASVIGGLVGGAAARALQRTLPDLREQRRG